MANGNIITIEELAILHQPGQRLFGLDLGSKTIGIAVSDGLLSVASRQSNERSFQRMWQSSPNWRTKTGFVPW